MTEAGGTNNGTPGTPAATGDLDAADVDNPADAWQAVAPGGATANGYGSYQLTAAGVWTYTLDNNNAAVQALTANTTDSFTVFTADGTAQTVTITINAANDAPTAAVGAASATEQVIKNLDGVITVNDVDAGSGLLSVDVVVSYGILNAELSPGGVIVAGIGSSGVRITGTLAQIQAFLAGSAGNRLTYIADTDNPPATATLSVTVIDNGFTGAGGSLTGEASGIITIAAVNDAATITGTAAGDVTEAGGVNNGTPGVPTATGNLDATDPDNAADTWQAVAAGAASANGYGSYALSAAGVWTYTLNDNNAAVQALNGAATLTDTFTVHTADGTAQVVTVTIHAQNDAATITGNSTGDLVEAGGIGNGTPGVPVNSGDLNANDVDNTADAWQAVAAGAATANGYGTYALSAAGVWTYTLNDNNAAVQALNGAATLTDSFTAVTADGTSQVVTVTIVARNDVSELDLNGAAAGTSATAAYTENAAVIAIAPAATVIDVDTVNFDGGQLTVQISNGLLGQDVLSVINQGSGAGQIGVSGGTVTYQGVAIGVLAPVIGAPVPTVQIQFTPGLTVSQAAVQALLRAIGYNNISDAPSTAPRTVSFFLTDGDGPVGATATATININAVDDAPVARADALIATENAVLSGSVFSDNGSGADSDVDGPALQVSAVNGSAVNVGTQITLASGARLTVNANGTFSYDPNHAFDALPDFANSGASNTTAPDSFTYTLVGGNTVTVTLTVRGADSNGDILQGTGGADLLNGGIGVDTLTGGAGNDSYFVNAGDVVIELSGQGFDIVYASTSYVLSSGASVEVLGTIDNMATTALNLTGNELANYITGNAGANLLDGGPGGADALWGRGGDDSYYVDVGDDVIEYAGDGYDIVYARSSFVLSPGMAVEVLATIDNLAATAISLTGNALDNYITGNAGANTLNGGGGADQLWGREGDDSYFAEANDIVIEYAGQGYDILYAGSDYTLAAGLSIEVLGTANNLATTALRLTGNELDNYVTGNAGANVLDGGTGSDLLWGREGNDSYFADSNDVVLEYAGQGDDIIYARTSFVLGVGVSVEILGTVDNTLTTALNLTGNELANYVTGNAGANILDGGAGADQLFGRGGADTFAFTTALGGGNVDAILDFLSGTDKIALDDALFGGIGAPGSFNANAFFAGTAAHDTDDRIIYNSATGQLFYDADGSGSGAQVLFATFAGSVTLSASDFQVI